MLKGAVVADNDSGCGKDDIAAADDDDEDDDLIVIAHVYKIKPVLYETAMSNS